MNLVHNVHLRTYYIFSKYIYILCVCLIMRNRLLSAARLVTETPERTSSCVWCDVHDVTKFLGNKKEKVFFTIVMEPQKSITYSPQWIIWFFKGNLTSFNFYILNTSLSARVREMTGEGSHSFGKEEGTLHKLHCRPINPKGMKTIYSTIKRSTYYT